MSFNYARQFTMTLPHDLDQSLNRLVQQMGASRGEIVRTALREYISNPARALARKRARAGKAPVYAPPRAAYSRPLLGDVGLLSVSLPVQDIHGLYVSPKSGLDLPDIQTRATLALGRPVRGASGVILAIVAARYCMPQGMRPALTPTVVHQHAQALRSLASRQVKIWTVPEILLLELAKEAKRYQLHHPSLLRGIVREALANPAAAFPEGLRAGPDMTTAYQMRPLWADDSPHADTPADPVPSDDELDRIIEEQQLARDAEIRAELLETEASPETSPDTEGTQG